MRIERVSKPVYENTRSYPPLGRRSIKLPDVSQVVPCVVFCANTDAPFNGCRVAESTTLPPIRKVFCAEVHKHVVMVVMKSGVLIKFFIGFVYIAHRLYG